MRLLIAFIFLVFPMTLLATVKDKAVNKQETTKKNEEEKKEEPPKIGNFTLPASQQPGPLLSFGDNIIDKNQKRLLLFIDDNRGINKDFIDIVPGFLYGVTDNFSIFFNAPFAVYRQDENRATGFEDLFLQLEYAYYDKSTKTSQAQATIVGYVSMPTGSVKKNPNTGLGSTSLFLGATFNKMYVEWLVFASSGALLTNTYSHTKYANQYLYQMGFGKNICYIKEKQIFAWVVEFTGTYASKNTIQSARDPNSGGNVVYVTPSLWLASQKFNIQFGVGAPIIQHLSGEQNRGTYLLAMNLGLTI